MPLEDAELSLFNKLVGNIISNAPNKLNAKRIKIEAKKIFIHGLFAKFLIPAALESKANNSPKIVNVTIIPVAKTNESATLLALAFSALFVKNDTVIGIIG